MASPALRRSNRRSIPTLASNQQIAASTSQSVPVSPPLPVPTPKRSRNKTESDIATPIALVDAPTSNSSRTSRVKRTIKVEEVTTLTAKQEDDEALKDEKPATTKKRRTKKQAEEEAEIFPLRPSPRHSVANGLHQCIDRRGSGLFIGAHISSAGGVENAPLNALRIGGNAFSCFVRPKMQWASNPITDISAEHFKQRVLHHGYMPTRISIKKEEGLQPDTNADHGADAFGYVVPHGCYLVNLANPDPAKREKSFEAFIDDLQRCEQLGIRLFNFHPGSMTAASATGEEPPDVGPMTEVRAAKAEACALVASYINRAHSLTSSVVILIENMAGSKNDTLLGSSLHDLASIISNVNDKSRVGVCIDTCHAFAAGYDLTSPITYSTFASLIDSTIGWETVRAFHLNDSKFPLGCKRDRHANVARGYLGLGAFWSVVNDQRWNGIPLILETPALGNAVAAYTPKEGQKKMHQVWSYQIQALYALRGAQWGEWREAEEWLHKADMVVDEAENLYAEKKVAKAQSAPKKGKVKGKKEPGTEEEEESELSSEE